MVTFRFYLVSVVAFFLALAVGVVVGSVLDGRIADSLQDRLDRVETSLDETVAAMDDKNREIDHLDEYIEASAPYAVQDELVDTTALVVAEDGVDAAPVEDLVVRLRQAGARVDGIVWLEAAWDLEDREQLDQLAAIAGAQGSTPTAVRRSFWTALVDPADDTTATPDETTTTLEPPAGESPTTDETTTTEATTTTEGDTVELVDLFSEGPLVEAEDAGLLRLQRIDGGGSGGGELVVAAVTGSASALSTPGEAAVEVAEEAAAAGAATTLAELLVVPPGTTDDRGRLTTEVAGEGQLGYSTVDDLDLVSGRVAVALALAAARDEIFGRFGYGPEADAVLPAWRGP